MAYPRPHPQRRPLSAAELEAFTTQSRVTPVNPCRDAQTVAHAWTLIGQYAPPSAEGRLLSVRNIVQAELPQLGQRAPGMLYAEAGSVSAMAIKRLGLFVLAWSPSRLWDPRSHAEAYYRYAMERAFQRNNDPGRWKTMSDAEQLRWFEEFRNQQRGWIVLWGDEGTGKTALAYASILTAACYGTVGAHSVIVPDIVKRTDLFGEGGKSGPWAQVLHDLKRNNNLVLIDDLAYAQRGQMSETTAEKWSDVLMARQGLPTIITSNCDPMGSGTHPRSLAFQLGNKAAGIIREQTAKQYPEDQRVFAMLGKSGRSA